MSSNKKRKIDVSHSSGAPPHNNGVNAPKKVVLSVILDVDKHVMEKVVVDVDPKKVLDHPKEVAVPLLDRVETKKTPG